MANKYYEVIGTIDGQDEVLYGSYQRADCVYEKDAEKYNWKDDGYKKIRIVGRMIEEAPDAEVYGEDIVTKDELFLQQAPSLNFEKDRDQLLKHALEVGFVTKIDGQDDRYLINTGYGEEDFHSVPVKTVTDMEKVKRIQRVVDALDYDMKQELITDLGCSFDLDEMLEQAVTYLPYTHLKEPSHEQQSVEDCPHYFKGVCNRRVQAVKLMFFSRFSLRYLEEDRDKYGYPWDNLEANCAGPCEHMTVDVDKLQKFIDERLPVKLKVFGIEDNHPCLIKFNEDRTFITCFYSGSIPVCIPATCITNIKHAHGISDKVQEELIKLAQRIY